MRILFMLIILFLSAPLAYADGMVHIYDNDMWNLAPEEQQYCAINYKEGHQHTILAIDTLLKGKKAVWIFPVPAKPGEISIDLINDFPNLMGYDVEKYADEQISIVFTTLRLTQLYTIPIFALEMMFSKKGSEQEVMVYESINSMGLTTELVSAEDSTSLSEYLSTKNLSLPDGSMSILDRYTEREYSFVIAWISDMDVFIQAREYDMRGQPGSPVGVSISFPTDRIFFPMMPTSVYGERVVPAVIYVLDYAVPEIYDDIREDIEVSYFFESTVNTQEELRDFFIGYETRSDSYRDGEREFERLYVYDVKYTKIKITSPAKDMTQDLWIDLRTPLKIQLANFAIGSRSVYGPLLFILCSCLASLLSGIILEGRKASKLKLALLGLSNMLTFIGFFFAVYLADSMSEQRQGKPLLLIAGGMLLAALAIPAIILLDYTGTFMLSPPFLLIIFFACLLLSMFVWGFYRNRKVLKFTLLFTQLFIVLTLILQYLLVLIL